MSVRKSIYRAIVSAFVLGVATAFFLSVTYAAEGSIPEKSVSESTMIKKVRNSKFYKYVGKGKITLSPKAKEKFEEFSRASDSGLFFLTEDGQNAYKTWCSYLCEDWGNAYYVQQKCEQEFGIKCFLYMIGFNADNSSMSGFRDKVVWDFWFKSQGN